MSVITFDNHSPIRISNDPVSIWSSVQDFGHHRIYCYTTKRARDIYWASLNSGRDYGSGTKTHRHYLPDIAAIKAYFVGCDMLATYLREVQAEIDPASILDVDLL